MTLECNGKSVIAVMNKFLRSVDEMNATVLVPRRLMDVPAFHIGDTNIADDQELAAMAMSMSDKNDLFKFYTMLLDTRNKILWGPGSSEDEESNCPIVKLLGQFNRTLVVLTDMAEQLKDCYERDVNASGR